MENTQLLAEIGKRLLDRRKELGLTQEEAADLLEMPFHFYGEVERGRRRLSIEKILLIYERMGMDPTWLLTGECLYDDEFSEFYRSCPKDKLPALEQILTYLKVLFK